MVGKVASCNLQVYPGRWMVDQDMLGGAYRDTTNGQYRLEPAV